MRYLHMICPDRPHYYDDANRVGTATGLRQLLYGRIVCLSNIYSHTACGEDVGTDPLRLWGRELPNKFTVGVRLLRLQAPLPAGGRGWGGGGGQGTACPLPALLRSATLPQLTLGEGLIVRSR